MCDQGKDIENIETDSTEKNLVIDASSLQLENIPHQLIQQLVLEFSKKLPLGIDTDAVQPDLTQDTGHNSLQYNFEAPFDSTTIIDDDPFYQTVTDIFSYFNQKISISSILYAIHISGGDVKKAIHKLKFSPPPPAESNDFTFHKVSASKEQIESYFTY
ncbi:hypothetical protein TRFO_11868 [Tritrichomonas foetus]|uniref:Uncharacterized protein n=1 Tax=Tritrichomonas foetus TaxID=1144522 RepID=A0A1J4J1N3_9EUKA|nr:hypothetical protein TRFO_11868 [Tritrichomonas foetus]|eukprot:OHS93432.1 hypothetical protein TRFO_11868 [Tritrichomonas foetus]